MQCVPLPTSLMKSTQLPAVKDRLNPKIKEGQTVSEAGHSYEINFLLIMFKHRYVVSIAVYDQ